MSRNSEMWEMWENKQLLHKKAVVTFHKMQENKIECVHSQGY